MTYNQVKLPRWGMENVAMQDTIDIFQEIKRKFPNY